MSIFQRVKENVTTRQAAEQYGLKVNRNGMICCPFHNDRHPSMKVDKGYYCFACGEKGDVISFVEKLFGLTAYEAAKKIAEDFGITIKESFEKRKVKPKKTRYKLMQEYEKWEKYCIRILAGYLHLIERWKIEFAPKQSEVEWKNEFVEACQNKVIVDYYLDILLEGALNDRINFC